LFLFSFSSYAVPVNKRTRTNPQASTPNGAKTIAKSAKPVGRLASRSAKKSRTGGGSGGSAGFRRTVALGVGADATDVTSPSRITPMTGSLATGAGGGGGSNEQSPAVATEVVAAIVVPLAIVQSCLCFCTRTVHP
jgi:hypothetical protein